LYGAVVRRDIGHGAVHVFARKHWAGKKSNACEQGHVEIVLNMMGTISCVKEVSV